MAKLNNGLKSNVESGSSRVQEKLRTSSTGAITAYSSEFTYDENKKRNRSLLAKLLYKKYCVMSVNATFIEQYYKSSDAELIEHAYFVASAIVGDDNGALESSLVALGEEFDQNCILSIPFGGAAKLIGITSGEYVNPCNEAENSLHVGSKGKSIEFVNGLRNGLFVTRDIAPPDTINGMWGISLCANKPWLQIN